MRVVVTGGSGLAGSAVLMHLLAHGHEVSNVDRVPGKSSAPFRRADLVDLGQAFGAIRGVDAVVHFAAIPRPTYDVPEVVFRTNVMSTFNVLEAAAGLGVPRVVIASSVSVLGFPFNESPLAPRYVPIDEDHPALPQDAYALSKHLGEELAAGFARRGRLGVISLRFPWIHTPETFVTEVQPFWSDPAGGAANLWSYIDTRDVAEAVRLALEIDITGHEACFVAAADSFMPEASSALVARYYPRTIMREGFGAHDSLLSGTKAQRLLEFQPRWSWRLYADLAGGG
jgi:nucleoside-diphosphate-sugar epimerase